MFVIIQKRLKELFVYNSDGTLRWKKPPTNRIQIGDAAQSLRKDGYYQTGVDGKIYLTHRMIYLFHYGTIPKTLDHINRIKQDNRIENLRDAKNFNTANRTKSANKSSKYKGVTWAKDKKKWKAQCKEKHVGYFKNEKAAAIAYNIRAFQLFGKYAHINTI